MKKSKSVIKIYKSRLHLAVTFLTIVVPFVFLLVFAEFTDIATGKLFLDVFVSLWRLVVAYGIAAILAWIGAILFYRGRRAAIALPIFDVLQSFPTFAALPLVTLFWGASSGTVIFFLVITIIWPILFSILGSLKLIRHEWEEVAKVSGLKGFTYLRYFVWPVSLPSLVTGSIIGLGEGWEAVVATEMVVGLKTGLGNFFQSFSRDTTISILGILGVLILIFSINKIIWLPLLEWSHRRMEE